MFNSSLAAMLRFTLQRKYVQLYDADQSVTVHIRAPGRVAVVRACVENTSGGGDRHRICMLNAPALIDRSFAASDVS